MCYGVAEKYGWNISNQHSKSGASDHGRKHFESSGKRNGCDLSLVAHLSEKECYERGY